MRVTLIGGTGTLGQRLLDKLCSAGHIVAVMSRGEHAQKELRAKYPNVRFLIGDVRDETAVNDAVVGADTVFLLAAIKHVDVAEENPLEAIKTNIMGAVNVGQAALRYGPEHVVYSNTDKAVLPITTYGYTKALAQNYLLSLNGQGVRFSAFNWGNVAASKGSVIPIFAEALLEGRTLRVTDPRMSRFWLLADDAANFMLNHYTNAWSDRAMVPPIKAATLLRVIESLARVLNVKSYKMETTGLRGTEKLYEVLESTHERCFRSDTCEQYTDTELDQMMGVALAK